MSVISLLMSVMRPSGLAEAAPLDLTASQHLDSTFLKVYTLQSKNGQGAQRWRRIDELCFIELFDRDARP